MSCDIVLRASLATLRSAIIWQIKLAIYANRHEGEFYFLERLMDKNRFWSNLVIGAGTVMVAFAIPHLIDDFLYQIA
jgi:hypothetical protein